MRNKNKLFKIFLIILLLGGVIFFRERMLSGVQGWLVSKIGKGKNFIDSWWWGADSTEIEKNLAEKDTLIKTLEGEVRDLRRGQESLESALSFKKNSRLSIRGARVLLYSKDFGREFMIIDQGRESGIENQNLVIDEKGALVGVVQEAGSDSAKIDILVNPGRSFEVEIRESGTKALAEGLGARNMSLKLVPSSTTLERGQIIYLSGIKTVSVGTISDFKENGIFLDARVEPLSRPEWLKNVFVISL